MKSQKEADEAESIATVENLATETQAEVLAALKRVEESTRTVMNHLVSRIEVQDDEAPTSTMESAILEVQAAVTLSELAKAAKVKVEPGESFRTRAVAAQYINNFQQLLKDVPEDVLRAVTKDVFADGGLPFSYASFEFFRKNALASKVKSPTVKDLIRPARFFFEPMLTPDAKSALAPVKTATLVEYYTSEDGSSFQKKNFALAQVLMIEIGRDPFLEPTQAPLAIEAALKELAGVVNYLQETYGLLGHLVHASVIPLGTSYYPAFNVFLMPIIKAFPVTLLKDEKVAPYLRSETGAKMTLDETGSIIQHETRDTFQRGFTIMQVLAEASGVAWSKPRETDEAGNGVLAPDEIHVPLFEKKDE